MIVTTTKINVSKLMTSTIPCNICSATIEFGAFTPATCYKCRTFVPNYTLLTNDLKTRVEYYRHGRISGIPAK